MLVRLTGMDGHYRFIDAAKVVAIYHSDAWHGTYIEGGGFAVKETTEEAAKIVNAGKLLSYATPAQAEKIYERVREDGLASSIPYLILGAAAFGMAQ
jgi:hypothetical protein